MGNCWSAKNNTSDSTSQINYPYQQNINRNESPKYISNIQSTSNSSERGNSTYNNTRTDTTRNKHKKVDVLDTMGNTIKPIVERAEKTGTCNLSGKKMENVIYIFILLYIME